MEIPQASFKKRNLREETGGEGLVLNESLHISGPCCVSQVKPRTCMLISIFLPYYSTLDMKSLNGKVGGVGGMKAGGLEKILLFVVSRMALGVPHT